jgi:RHS repeat-associated protein
MKMDGISSTSTTSNDYLYNGKQLQDDFGLNWYDYGARFYDPALGRWHSVDPSAERDYSYSPYIYCANNPIKYIDPDG